MKNRAFFYLFVLLLAGIQAPAQNISGLLHKKLNKIDDVASVIESGIGSLLGGGRVKGSIDSVVVLNDSERELQLKIYYTGFENTTLKVQAANAQKQKQEEIIKAETPLAATPAPVTCLLTLKPDISKGQSVESPFLRIEITKEANKPGQVINYALNKKWKVDLDPENVVVAIKPQPIGSAGALRESEVKDVQPAKEIIFDATKLYYNPKLEKKTDPKATELKMQNIKEVRLMNLSGGTQSAPNYFSKANMRTAGLLSDDISGTWTNTDPNTTGLSKVIITNNREIQAFRKCSPTDCDWGKTTLTDNSNNTFQAYYDRNPEAITLDLAYTNSQITLTQRTKYANGLLTNSATYTFKRNVVLNTLLLAPQLSIRDFAVRQPSTTTAAPDYTAKGADNKPIYLWADLKSDIDIEKPQDISNINMNIFPDKNPASGVYYFLPADYHLRYENRDVPEKGYNMSILYGSNTAAEEAPVRMSAKLTAGISTREIAFIRTLLKASIPTAKEVRLLPLRENPVFSFQSYLTSQYNIPQNKIAVESSTDLSNDIRVAWQTDATTKEFIQTALTSREGLAASVILKPQSEAIIDQQIPVTINLADGRTLGKITLDPATWRSKKWQNTTPYPLQLKYLNILKLSESGRNPIIYSWSLGQSVVPSKAQVSFDPSLVPTWLDRQESVLMWIDYVVADCKACDEKVIDAITGGVSGNKAQLVKFVIPPVVFDSLQAAYFMINVRSQQLDPNGTSVKELPSALKVTKASDKEFAAGPLYVPTGGTLSFEYKITMATADGEFREGGDWIPATEKEILLGKTRMKTLFSSTTE